MPTLNAKIKDRVAGDDWPLRIRILDVDQADPVEMVWLTVKTEDTIAADDTEAVFQITLTESPNAYGQIDDDGSATGMAIVSLVLRRALTALLSPGTPYVADVQYRTSVGDLIETPIKVLIEPQQGVTTTT